MSRILEGRESVCCGADIRIEVVPQLIFNSTEREERFFCTHCGQEKFRGPGGAIGVKKGSWDEFLKKFSD